MGRRPEPCPTDDECKHAFLKAAGISNNTSYTDLSTHDTIESVRKAAGIESKDGLILGHSKQAYFQTRDKAAKGSLEAASNLGTKFSPALDEATKTGRIDRATGTIRPEWLAQQGPTESELKTIFCNIIGVNPADYADHSILPLLKTWSEVVESLQALFVQAMMWV